MSDTCLDCGHHDHPKRACAFVDDRVPCPCDKKPPSKLHVCPTCLGAGIIYEDAEAEKDVRGTDAGL